MEKLNHDIEQVLSEISEKKGLIELEVKAWKALLQSKKILVALADVKTGYFVYVNPALKCILGYNHKDLIKYPISYFLHQEDVLPTEKAFKKSVLAKDHTFDGFINRYMTKNNEVIYLNWFENLRLNGTWLSFIFVSNKEDYQNQKEKFPEIWQE